MSDKYTIRTSVNIYDEKGDKIDKYKVRDRLLIYDKFDNLIFDESRIYRINIRDRIRSNDIREYIKELEENQKIKVVNKVTVLGGYGTITNTKYIDEDDFSKDYVNYYIINTDIYENQLEELKDKYIEPESKLGGIELDEVDLTRIEGERNIDTIITSIDGSGSKVRAFTQENSMSFDSEEIRIEGTDFIESIRRQPEIIELSLVLGDVWKDGEISTHRDKELEKLKDMYDNNDLLRIESNLTHDIYGSYEGNIDMKNSEDLGERTLPRIGTEQELKGLKRMDSYRQYLRLDVPNVANLDNVIIESMEVTQSGDSANTYECNLTLKKLNFVESENFIRKPTELTGSRVVDGEIDRSPKKIEISEEEVEEEETEGKQDAYEKWHNRRIIR